VLFAVKPLMQLRVWATLPLTWPEIPATLSSRRMMLDGYFTPELSQRRSSTSSSATCSGCGSMGAEDGVVALGFTKHLIAEE
jgi:hypothetical protein